MSATDDDEVHVVHVDDLPELKMSSGSLFRPVRRKLALTGVSAHAYTGIEVGDEVIEPHDELSPNAGGHEELYIVMTGRATFELADEEIDAPVGTMIRADVKQHRAAKAAEPNTTVLVVGAVPGAALPASPFEYWYASEPAYLEGDYERGIEILSEGLDAHPTNGGINYQLACYHALAGHPEKAVKHLKIALQSDDHRIAGWAAEDEDFGSIRDREDFPNLDA